MRYSENNEAYAIDWAIIYTDYEGGIFLTIFYLFHEVCPANFYFKSLLYSLMKLRTDQSHFD